MTPALDPHIVYPEAHLFLDYLDARGETSFFEYNMNSLPCAAAARQASLDTTTRAKVTDVLLAYNQQLAASQATLSHLADLRTDGALCVIGGQQAGFLGGPVFVLYKIVSIIRRAQQLSRQLDVPVVPIFWLATEDHDFSEINHIRWVNPAAALQTIKFDWQERGRAIEQLPITKDIRSAYEDALDKLPFSSAFDRQLLEPASSDTYARWHARLWSRLFAPWGLILVEPHVLRPLSNRFFERARTETDEIQHDLEVSAAQLSRHGYQPPLDPHRAGTLFVIPERGARRRIEDIDSLHDVALSADAALRPVWADSLLPTVMNVLGPSELAYHAMLRPLYRRFNVPQPLAVPRSSGTIVDADDARLLDELGLHAADVISPSFDVSEILRTIGSPQLRSEFAHASTRLRAALEPLRTLLQDIDPGLTARWDQTLDQSRHQLDRLEDRALRAELSHRGISAKQLAGLKVRLFPTGHPQERVIAAVSVLARYGVEWIYDLIDREEWDPFDHHLVVLGDTDE